MTRLAALPALLWALAGAACASAPETAETAIEPEILAYEVVNIFPHDERAFTQGLFFRDSALYETTGQYGESTLRRVRIETGEAEKTASLPSGVFGEGSAAWGDAIIILTWRRGVGFVVNAETFAEQRRFGYEGEGWGLTEDGEKLIMSDGSSTLRFLDPDTLEETGSLDVTFRGKPLPNLNELEWIHGAIFANVWQSNAIVRIDPQTGAVNGLLDMRGLLEESDIEPGRTDVLNGIAYDPQTDRLFVTGKNWPKLFEIKFSPRKPSGAGG